jgi:hypothetical protein
MITLGPIGSTSGKETKLTLRTVKGAQAEGAKTHLGLIKITKPSARGLWEKGIAFVMVGNQVNDAHFFHGWQLALRIDTGTYSKENTTFDVLVNQFAFYMERELGNAVAFFVFADEFKKRGALHGPAKV